MNAVNNKYYYFSYLFGKKEPYPTFLIKNSDNTFSKIYHEQLPCDKHKDLDLNGYCYQAEKTISKNLLLLLYKVENKLWCDILDINNSSKDFFKTKLLFSFEINSSLYQIKNKYRVIYDCFQIFNYKTNKIEFNLCYLHPYNRTLYYDGMAEDMIFKEISENYGNEKWKNELLNIFV